MREYKDEAICIDSEFDDIILEIEKDLDALTIREYLYYYSDSPCYWAKEIGGKVFYSKDNVFSTEQEDATHIVPF